MAKAVLSWSNFRLMYLTTKILFILTDKNTCSVSLLRITYMYLCLLSRYNVAISVETIIITIVIAIRKYYCMIIIIISLSVFGELVSLSYSVRIMIIFANWISLPPYTFVANIKIRKYELSSEYFLFTMMIVYTAEIKKRKKIDTVI